MLSRLKGHLRSHVVAYIALFFALSGTAVAAKPLLTGADIQDGSLTGADVQDNSLKGSDVDESSLGKVGDANTLDGFDSADYGGVMSGRISFGTGAQFGYGAPIGISTASNTEDPVTTLSPDHVLQARDLKIQATEAHGGGGADGSTRTVDVWINHGSSSFGCTMPIGVLSCTASGPVTVPAGSTLSIRFATQGDLDDITVVQYAFRLTP